MGLHKGPADGQADSAAAVGPVPGGVCAVEPLEDVAQVLRADAFAVVGRDVWLDGEPVSLTRTEFDLLAVLSERPRMAFGRRQLIDAVWGGTWVGDEHLVDVHIGHLRRKLGDDAAAARFIRTVRGIGYRMGTGE